MDLDQNLERVDLIFWWLWPNFRGHHYMKAVFYSVWILTKCIDTCLGVNFIFKVTPALWNVRFDQNRISEGDFLNRTMDSGQFYIWASSRGNLSSFGIFNNTGTDQPAHPRSLNLNRTMEQWILVNFYIWPRREKTCLRGFLQQSLISAFVVHYLESFICKLATGKISVFCSWGDWFETRFVRNPEDRFSHDEAQIIIVLLQYNIELVTWPNLVGHHPFKTEYQHFLSSLSYEPYVDFHRSWRYTVWRRKRINIIRFRLPWPWGFFFKLTPAISNFKFWQKLCLGILYPRYSLEYVVWLIDLKLNVPVDIFQLHVCRDGSF